MVVSSTERLFIIWNSIDLILCFVANPLFLSSFFWVRLFVDNDDAAAASAIPGGVAVGGVAGNGVGMVQMNSNPVPPFFQQQQPQQQQFGTPAYNNGNGYHQSTTYNNNGYQQPPPLVANPAAITPNFNGHGGTNDELLQQYDSSLDLDLNHQQPGANNIVLTDVTNNIDRPSANIEDHTQQTLETARQSRGLLRQNFQQQKQQQLPGTIVINNTSNDENSTMPSNNNKKKSTTATAPTIDENSLTLKGQDYRLPRRPEQLKTALIKVLLSHEKLYEENGELKQQLEENSNEPPTKMKTNKKMMDRIAETCGQASIYGKTKWIHGQKMAEQIADMVFEEFYKADEEKLKDKDYRQRWLATYTHYIPQAYNAVRGYTQGRIKTAAVQRHKKMKTLPTVDDILRCAKREIDWEDPADRELFCWYWLDFCGTC